MKNYFIKESYTPRLTNKYFDDTDNTDLWQKEVYWFAKKIAVTNGFQTIADIGTGSGYKLIENFSEMKTLGIDLPPTVKWLREKYPNNKALNDRLNVIEKYNNMIDEDYIQDLREDDDYNYNFPLIKRAEDFQKLAYNTIKKTLYNEGKKLKKIIKLY